MTEEDQKTQEAAVALNAFFTQFGTPDIYTNIVLEVLFEEIYGKTVMVHECKSGVDSQLQ